MSIDAATARLRAEASFQITSDQPLAEQLRAEQEALARAVQEKTARLRALRLAKEAAERGAAAAAKKRPR